MEKVTQKMILAMLEELQEEEKKIVWVPVYYKRYGQMLRRSYDDKQETERCKELRRIICMSRVFKCPECGQKVSYYELCQGICEDCWGDDL